MNEFAIFYHTCDKYSDLWIPFCDFFKKYWPDYSGKIYINSEEKDFDYNGLNIVNLKVGVRNFSDREIAGLQKVEEDYILLMMDDLFLMNKVDSKLVEEYFQFFLKCNLDTLVLRNASPNEVTVPLNFRKVEILIPPSVDMLSSQLAFWKKIKFIECLNVDDGPWEMEWFGSMRANVNHLKTAYTNDNAIPSLPGGALRVGKWDPQYIEFLENEKYIIDFSKRGVYDENTPNTLKKRIQFQIRNWFSKTRWNLIILLWSKRKYYWSR